MMKRILQLLAFVPMYVIAFLWTLTIYSEDYYFMAMKVNACVGLLTIYYFLYKFTLCLQKKLADSKEIDILEKEEQVEQNDD